MNPQASSESGQQTVKVFSAAWSEKLGTAIAAAAPKCGYRMSLVGEDCQAVITAVNQGIDARLEACFVPDRGDRFSFAASGGPKIAVARLECKVSPESLVTLVRRLMESGEAAAESVASGICQTLGIELV